MLAQVAWVGLLVTVLAFASDGIMWSFVLTKGMSTYASTEGRPTPRQFMQLMSKQLANTLLFGWGFTLLYAWVHTALPVQGVLGALLFGGLLWLPTTAHVSVSNSIWYGKVIPLARGNAITALVKLLLGSVVVGLLIG